jgi:titin
MSLAPIAIPGNGLVYLSWKSSQSSYLSSYNIELYNYDDNSFVSSVETYDTTITIYDLKNGQSYYLTVSPLDSGRKPIDDPSYSNSVTPIESKPVTKPDALTTVSATTGDAQATVSWNIPTNNGGSSIISYVVICSSSEGETQTIVDGSTTTTTIYGLTNGTTYTFTVVATNAAGDSPPSAASNPVTPNIVPNAPTSVIATAGNTTANLSWTAPVSNGGTDISSYSVISSPIGGIATINFAARTATVTDLSNGTAYTFTILATNAAGPSLPSTASDPVTPTAPISVPNAPTSVSATARDEEAIVSWSIPTNNGGSTIKSYIVISNSSEGETETPINDGQITTTTITRLTNGTTYTFRVIALNDVGPSLPSDASDPVTPTAKISVPSQIESIDIVYSNDRIDLSWNIPFNGGSNIIDYLVQGYIVSSNELIIENYEVENYLVRSNFGSLIGQQLRISIRARNSIGLASTPTDIYIIPFTVPSAPTLTATAGNGLVDLSWNAPNSNGDRKSVV